MRVSEFQSVVWDYYQQNARALPWREPEPNGSFDSYKILVSEVMLQQTQARRVVPKYRAFLEQFPSLEALANATLQEVLTAWSGLGYNRRAKFLWQAVQHIAQHHDGTFPQDVPELTQLPGIGKNTATAILVYAYNRPLPFIETNIRTVFIYHFFPTDDAVTDAQIYDLVGKSIDPEHPREWYWALMDYGAHLKATVGNLSRSSKHYVKQSTFRGSNREIRGKILKLLTARPYNYRELKAAINDDRFEAILEDLHNETLVRRNKSLISL